MELVYIQAFLSPENVSWICRFHQVRLNYDFEPILWWVLLLQYAQREVWLLFYFNPLIHKQKVYAIGKIVRNSFSGRPSTQNWIIIFGHILTFFCNVFWFHSIFGRRSSTKIVFLNLLDFFLIFWQSFISRIGDLKIETRSKHNLPQWCGFSSLILLCGISFLFPCMQQCIYLSTYLLFAVVL